MKAVAVLAGIAVIFIIGWNAGESSVTPPPPIVETVVETKVETKTETEYITTVTPLPDTCRAIVTLADEMLEYENDVVSAIGKARLASYDAQKYAMMRVPDKTVAAIDRLQQAKEDLDYAAVERAELQIKMELQLDLCDEALAE